MCEWLCQSISRSVQQLVQTKNISTPIEWIVVERLCGQSWFLRDEASWLWFPPDFSSIAPIRLLFDDISQCLFCYKFDSEKGNRLPHMLNYNYDFPAVIPHLLIWCHHHQNFDLSNTFVWGVWPCTWKKIPSMLICVWFYVANASMLASLIKTWPLYTYAELKV